MPSSNLLTCVGLVTYTSETNAPEGSLVIADNVNIDEPNVITPRRGFDDFLSTISLLDDTKRLKQIIQYKNKIIRHWDDHLEYEDGTTFSQFSGNFSELQAGLRIKAKESNSNLYITTSDGIKKISATDSSDFTTSADYIVSAGAAKATDLFAKIVPSSGGFLPPQSKVAYRCLFGYKDANSNLLLGTPSSRYILSNTSSDLSVPEQDTLTITGTTFSANDYILFNSTTTSYYLWFDTTGSSNIPVTNDTVGKTAIRVILNGYTGSASQIAAKIAESISSSSTEFVVSSNSNIVTIENTKGGNVTDISTGSSGVFSSNITVATSVSGLIVEASAANGQIEAIIPTGVDTSYFFQLYRSSIITAADGVNVDEISPDDELQLVYETPITASNITSGTIIVLDSTPESFRESGLPLYTNAQTGETILQSNDRPPVATDLESFRNSMFYSNTSIAHKLNSTLLSVDDFISESTQFYVGDSSGIQSYTFRGSKETFELTPARKSRTVGGSYLNLYSANNLVDYYMWLYKGAFTLSFNSTADVNAATDEITIPSHGLETNDAVVAGGTTPGGITSGTTYYAIRISDNIIQLSATVNGSAVNIATAIGTGTLFHEAVDPAIAGKVGIRVDLSLYPDSLAGTKEAIIDSFLEITDFSVSDTVTTALLFTLSYNGDAKLPTFSTPTPGSQWSLVVTNEGRGETRRGSITALALTNPVQITAANHGLETGDSVTLSLSTIIALNGNHTITVIDPNTFSVVYNNTLGSTDTGSYREVTNFVYLSNYPSISQAIEETAKSLIKMINLNQSSSIIGFYTSGADDLPGKMLFEKKSLEDESFYIAISSSSLSGEFNPDIPAIASVSTVTFSAGSGSAAKITTPSPNGLSSNSYLYVSSPNTTPSFAGKYKITVLSPTAYTVPVNITGQDLVGTSCFYYLATQESSNEKSINRLYFSKFGIPEAVPYSNYIDIGPKDKAILRILALRDNLFVIKEDGIYIVSGQIAPNFSVRLLDRNAAVTAPDTAVVLNNQIFALADQGVISISESGAPIISRLIEDKIKAVTNNRFNYKSLSFGVGYETDRAYIIWLPTKTTDEVSTQCYRYNIFEKTWTRWTKSATCVLVKDEDDKLYLGAGDRAFIQQERKSNDRTDYADRSILKAVSTNGYNPTDRTIILNSVLDVEVGDVILQEQTVTISIYNRLLRKLDIDGGVGDANYETTLLMNSGDNLASKLNMLNAKLYVDIGSPIDNSRVFTNDFEAMRTKYNDLIDELNDISASTLFKNYKKIETEEDYPTPYEAIIIEVTKSINKVKISLPAAFVEGELTIYKNIKNVIQWSPLHYGNPMAFKQVNTATCIFDQNNFYSATMSFSSDLSQSFVEIPFYGKGLGYWGYGTWGDVNLYWGGNGNDVPYRDFVPQEKQRCRYLNVKFSHVNSREYWRILGISSNVRPYSDRAYKSVRG